MVGERKQAKFHKIPVMRFEDQKLTSFSGLLIFQLLFKRLDLKQRLKQCFAHLPRLFQSGCLFHPQVEFCFKTATVSANGLEEQHQL